MNTPHSPPTPEPTPLETPVPTWVKVIGICFLGLAVVFFIVLVFAAVLGHSVPANARFLVCVVLALCSSIGAGFLGGTARASGTFTVPKVLENPITFGITGGIAVLVIVLVLCHLFYKESSLTVSRPTITDVTASSDDTKSAIISINYKLDSLPPQHKLFAEVASDPSFKAIVRKFQIDNFANGQVVLAVQNPQTTKHWARLVVESPDGSTVTESDPWEFNIT